MNDVPTVANTLFNAIQEGNIEAVKALYHEDIEVWHNVSGVAQTREQNLKLLGKFTSAVSSLEYRNIDRNFFDGGFVQRHTLTCTNASGQDVSIDVAIIIHVDNGLITRIYEYLDSAAFAPVFS